MVARKKINDTKPAEDAKPLDPGLALYNKYRPKKLEDVRGQVEVVSSLAKIVGKGTAKAFLFTGPSGTGKTTLARIVADLSDCDPKNILDFDAATYTGIDDIRGITANLFYKPLDGRNKAVIIDECHALSKNAWNSLLKILEEPPKWVYWFLCTTEPGKVPDTIKTRCASFNLKPVTRKVLATLIDSIAEKEGISWGSDNEDVIQLLASEANGSPRQAISYLATAAGVTTYDEVASLMGSAESSAEAIDLARLLMKGASWGACADLCKKMKDLNPESVRHVVRAYITAVLLNAKDERRAGPLLAILDAFGKPFNSGDGISPVLLACGSLTLGE